MTRRAGPLGLAIRAATTTPALSLFAILVVAATAFAGAVTPGLLQQLQSDSLRYALAATDPTQRDFSASTRGAPVAGGTREELGLGPEVEAVWGSAVQQLRHARGSMDSRVREVLNDPRIVAEFDPSEAVVLPGAEPRPRSQLYLRYDPELDGRVRWTSGERPRSRDDGTVEFGLTAESADVMAWEIGEERILPRPGGGVQQVVLTGLYEPVDAADADWAHAPLGLEPNRVQRGLEPPLFSAVAFAAPEDLQTPAGWSDLVTTTAWYPLDLERIRADGARELIASMRRLGAESIVLDVTVESFLTDGLQFSSTAPITLTEALVRVEATSAVVALIASGPLAVSVVVLALTARMLALRRRTSLQLAAARGASVHLRAGLLAAEGAVIGTAGALAGGIPGAVLGQGSGPVAATIPVLAALTPAVALPAIGMLVARRRSRSDLGAGGSATAARWRLAAEAGVVALAVAAVVLVLTGAGSAERRPDPVLIAVPLLLAAAGCVLTLRLLPLGLGIVERASGSRRGLIALLGPARARRDPAVRVAPVLAVVVGVAIAVFSIAFSTTVDAGIRVAARAAVGADLRVQAAYLNEDQLAALATLDGVRATAPVYADEQRTAELPSADLTVMVYVIDVAQLRAVQTDPDAAMPLPDALLAGDASEPVPVLASDELAARAGAETLVVQREPVQIVATAPADTPLGSTRNWIAVDRSQAERLVRVPFSPAVVLLDLEPGADAATVAEEARRIAGTGALAATPASVAATRLEDPSLAGLRAALAGAVGVVGVLLALAIGMTLVLGAPARGRLLALLGALGYRRTRELGLVAWEVVPALAIAVPVGALVGLGLPWVVVPAIDLTGFVGGVQPAVRLGGVLPLLVVLGFIGVTAVAVLLAAFVARRVTAARTLRSIDEEG